MIVSKAWVADVSVTVVLIKKKKQKKGCKYDAVYDLRWKKEVTSIK